MKPIKPVVISGRETLPIIEGGKGVSISTGLTSGAFAAAAAVGTVSGVNADFYDENGVVAPKIYAGKTRVERHRELIDMSVRGAIDQVKIAHDIANGQGRLHLNVLWEMAGAEEVLERSLEATQGLVHGVTCGAGMPYGVSDIAAKHQVWYYPIVSSARAFRALWKRSYRKTQTWLGGVVYEDPWLAGGHNGLSNVEDPRTPQAPYPRVRELRAMIRALGSPEVVIIMAGGVWCLDEWEDWIDNPEIGPIAFQFGTRPLLTKESPICEDWKQHLLTLQEGDVLLHHFSPTGFYSSAVRNHFLRDLEDRSVRQVRYSRKSDDELTEAITVGPRGRDIFVTADDKAKVRGWMADGFTDGLRTPSGTMIFVTPRRARDIVTDQKNCMGCLSACAFSNWSQGGDGFSTGRVADPRSFCIQKTLQDISHGASIDNNLMFAGHNAYRFADDPFYAGGHVPTIAELVARILTGR